MNKKILILILAGLAAAIALVWIGVEFINNSGETVNNQARQESGIVLYYGLGCPYCKIVDEYIEKNKLASRIIFSTKEVYYNRQNAIELSERAAACGMPSNQIGIPFLWDGSRCYVGSDSIIAFFENQLKLNQ